MWTRRQAQSRIGVGACAVLTAIACGKVDHGPGSNLTAPDASAAGQSATPQPGTGGTHASAGGPSPGGTSATTGGKPSALGGSGSGEETAAGGAAITPEDCTYYDGNGDCATPPELLGTIPDCGTLQLRREAGALLVLNLKSAKLWRIGLTPRSKPSVLASDLFDVASKAAPSAFTTDSKSAYVAAGVTITRIGLSTGDRATVTTVGHPILDVAVAGGTLYYIRGNELATVDAAGSNNAGHTQAITDGGPTALAFTANHMVWVDEAAAELEAKPMPNGLQFTLAPSQGGLLTGPGSIQADAKFVYWSNFVVRRAEPSKPVDFAEQFGSPLGEITAFALDAGPDAIASSVYYATSIGELQKSVPGGESTWLASDLGSVTSIAADGAHVYAANTDCKVLAVPNDP